MRRVDVGVCVGSPGAVVERRGTVAEIEAVIRQLTAAQRQVVLDADPDSGEVRTGGRGAQPTCARLLEVGVAVRHGLRGAVYLTSLGRQVREELRRGPSTGPGPAPGAAAGFEPLMGGEPVSEQDPGRAAEAAQVWESALLIRRHEGTGEYPATWEVRRIRRAVALCLEAGSLPAAARDTAGRWARTGYRVTDLEPKAARVDWSGPAASWRRDDAERQLLACAKRLEGWGWQTALYLGTRRSPYLWVAPQRAPAR